MKTSLTQKTSVLGCFLILLGTAIGAGILALPMAAASLHFPSTALLLIGLWFISTISALYLVEVNLAMKGDYHHFSTMARVTLGRVGQAIIWVSCLLLLYSLTWAYFAGSGSLISTLIGSHTHWHPSSELCQVLFAIVFGGAVYWSTRAVDILNRGLWSLKGLSILVMLALLLPKIHWQQLIPAHTPFSSHAIFLAAPIFVTAFGFHTVIPSLRGYLGPDAKKLKIVIISGTVVALACYLIWAAAVIGIIPATGPASFASLQASHGSVGQLMRLLTHFAQSTWVSVAINSFSNIAMTTSFLGVTLGLFDFIADALKRKNSRFGRFQTAMLTFIPPLALTLLHSNGFIYALGYAGIFVAVICVMAPAAMAYKLRQKVRVVEGPVYRVWGGTPLLALVFLSGVALILCQLLA